MSIYPRFNSSNTFNSKDVISYEETNSGQTVVSLDLSSFVQKSAPVFENELYLKEGVQVNYNGAKQSTAFSDAYKTDVETSKDKLTSINYSNNKTTLTQELDLTGASVTLNDDQIGQEKITNLVSRLTDIDTNLANINSNDTDIANLNSTTATHTTHLSAIESKNDTQDGRLTTIETDTENITIRITDAENDITNLEATDTQHDASLNELFGITSTLTNDVISLNNMDTDISTNLNTYKISNDAVVVSINDDITDIQGVDVTQNNRLDAIETLNVTQDGRLDVIETLNTTQDGRLEAVETLNTTQDGRLDAVETLAATHTADLSNLHALQLANISNITTLQGENTTQSSQISTLETQMVTKMPTINNANKLNVAYLGNGDVSNDKLSALNDVRTDVSIQNQINTINDNITGLDALQDLDIVNIPILQNNVTNLVAKDILVDTSLNALATDIASNVSDIATNASDIASNVSSISSANTSITNNANSISTINTNVAALVSADGIHDTQITDLHNADTVLQANIDLKEDIISLSNKLNTTKIFDTGLNDSLDALLSTIDSNISLLNSSKQDNITTINKLSSSLLNRDDNLLFCDATSSIQGQINNINSNIALLQGIDTTIISDIQANFDTHDASITANSNAISTLQGLQDGDVVSFNSINNSITNLTNTKHSLIDINNKLNSSLLNRDDNLQHIDITSSLQNKLDSLDTDISIKQNEITNANKLDATLLNLNNTLQYADYGSSITTKFASIDTSISSLNTADVNQSTTNTNLQNSINSNATDITNLQNFQSSQLTTNTTLQSNIDNIDLSSKQDVLTNASSVAFVDITSGLQTSLTTLQNNIDNIDLSSKQDVLTNASSVAFVDITSGLQTSLNTLQNNIDSITPEQTLNDMFYNYKVNMPSIENSKTLMTFTIDSENYQIFQSSYYGIFESSIQSTPWTVQNLFDDDETSLFRMGYKNNWFYNQNDVLIKYNDYQYDINGDYVGAFSQQDYNTLINYSGEYLDIQNPFYFKPTSLYIKANLSGQMPLRIYLMGSNNNTDYELIETLTTTANEEITYNITTNNKYKTFKIIFNKSGTQLGITLKTLKMSGIKSTSLLSDSDKITNNTNDITQLQTDVSNIDLSGIATNANNITTNTNNITTNTNNITTNGNSITTNANNITTNTNNIATNTNNITTNASNITTLIGADVIHNSQIGDLQTSVNLKQNIIDVNNKLNSSNVFDTALNDTVDDILTNQNNLITSLQNDKQNVIDVNNKVVISNVDLTGSNLVNMDYGTSVNSKFTALDGQISTLTGLQNGDIANFTAIDASLVDLYDVKQDVIDVNNKVSISNVDLTGSSLANMDYGSSVVSKFSSLDGQITTLTGLQNGDTANFTAIDASLVDLYTVKQDLFNDTTNKLAISKVDLTGSSLANMDYGSSVDAKMTSVDADIATKHNIIDGSNKLNSSFLDLSTTNLQYADFGSSINTKMTSLDTQITNLTATDTSQATQNTTFTNLINTANSNIALKQDLINDTTNKLEISKIDLTGSDLVNMDYSTGSLTTKLNSLQTNIDNVVVSSGSSSKIEPYGTTNYNPSVNVITHTYDEKNLFIDPLDDNALMELDLTLSSPTDLKNYKQVLTINCLEFKSYVNVLKINGTVIEMKHRDGDTNINLAPIAGYSMITQTLDLTRIAGVWYVMSNIDLFYNSASNTAYDITPPVITLLGDAVVNHEINSVYTDAGATATDNLEGDMTGSIIVSGDTVNVAVLGAYNIYYDVSDGIPNDAIQKTRVVNVVDTTNPVVTLTGDAEVTIIKNSTYTEEGATATDNSLETLTVTIAGDTVDTSTVGDYTPTYSATDSTGNTHQIGRLVHVVAGGLTLQYDNPSVDIYTLVDAYSVCNQNPTHTQNTSTVTTGPTYLQGDYIYNCSTIQNNSALMRSAFDNNSTIYASINTSHHIVSTSHLYVGNLTGFTDFGYAYDFTNNGIYIGKTIDNGTYVGPIYFSHQDYLTNINYDGEFLETIFPFFVELTQMSFTHYTSTFSPKQMVFMASEDGGLNYIHIETFNSPGVSYVANYTSTTKYNAFKVILTEATSAGHVFTMKNWKCYGKIYT